MKTYKEDVTFRYYDMLNSFRADNTIKINEVEENKIAFDKSFFEIEKDLIKNKNKRYFRDIDLLEELEFELRHENLKIVSVNRNLKEKESKIEEYKQEIERLNNIISEIERLIINHNCDTGDIYYKYNCDTGDIYYKYNCKYLKCELKERIMELVELKEYEK